MAIHDDFKNLTVTTKFILWFLFIALVPLALATYISYNSSRKILEQEVMNSLLVVADNKANQIESYLLAQKRDVTTLSHMSETIDAIEKYREAFEAGGPDAPAYAAVNAEFSPYLKYYQESSGYMDIFLVTGDGDVVFSAKGRRGIKSLYEVALQSQSEKLGDPEMVKIFMKTKESLQTEASNFEYYSESREVAVSIAAPVLKGPDLVGMVIAQISNGGLSVIVNDYSGLGRTGETIIASRIGDEAVFLTPVRFDPDAAFNRKVRIDADSSQGVQKAAEGQTGSGTAIDYRGKDVVSVWRFIPAFRLGMVVKMDTDEVYSSAQKLRKDLLSVSLVLLIAVIVMAIAIANSISGPIKDLTSVSEVITGGDLSARAEIKGMDEIGELAQSFNKMTDSLVEAKASVEEKKRLLEESNRELDSFVYTVSHDLKAPLRGIAAFADFLKQDYFDKLDAQGKDYITRIYVGANRMKQLIEDLLTLSRISRIKNPYEDVDVNELVRSIIDRVEYIIKENKVEMKVAKDLPVMRCDRIKMAEVFLNLITNAIKFSSKNKEAIPRVEIGYTDKDIVHEFYVRDNGIGIDKKYHKEIFGIFKRLHKQEEYEGSGAGLSIVKKVIDDHGGAVWVRSEPGKGAAFFFTIPKNIKEDVVSAERSSPNGQEDIDSGG